MTSLLQNISSAEKALPDPGSPGASLVRVRVSGDDAALPDLRPALIRRARELLPRPLGAGVRNRRVSRALPTLVSVQYMTQSAGYAFLLPGGGSGTRTKVKVKGSSRPLSKMQLVIVTSLIL